MPFFSGARSALARVPMQPTRAVAINATVAIGGWTGIAQHTTDPTRTYALGIFGAEPVTPGSGSELRFEVRGTDCDELFDPLDGTKNRTELILGTTVPFYGTITADFEFKLDGNGTVTDRSWLIPFQIHADDSIPASPIFALDIQPNAGRSGEIIRIAANNGPTNLQSTYRQFNAPANVAAFTRDVWHTVHVELSPDKNEGVGRIRCVYDGVELLNVSSVPTGFGNAVAPGFAKTGLYAGTPTQAADGGLVCHVRNATYAVSPPQTSFQATIFAPSLL